jgi:mercuric ion transport protein
MLLGSLGLGSAWLAGVAILAAPHRIALIAAAVVCLVGAGAGLAWYRQALTCAPGTACGSSAITPFIIGFISLGAALTIAGYLFA